MNEIWKNIAIMALILFFSIEKIAGIQPNDEIVLQSGSSYFIANETYILTLGTYSVVPRRIFRHKIFTASAGAVNSILVDETYEYAVEDSGTKRYTESSFHPIAQEDKDVLEYFTGKKFDHIIGIKGWKRNDAAPNGMRLVKLTDRLGFSHKNIDVTSKKRNFGTSFCVHVPFFTTCSNDQDIEAVKSTVGAMIDATNLEIDNLKEVLDKRSIELESHLIEQKNLINDFADQTGDLVDNIEELVNIATVDHVESNYADFAFGARLEYMQRAVKSLLRYSSAVANTDPRAVVAQPSIFQLFKGMLASMEFIQSMEDPQIPIVGTDTFDFTASILPNDAFENVEISSNPITLIDNFYSGFEINLGGSTGLVFGPIHLNQQLIFGATTLSFGQALTGNVLKFPSDANCIRFLGFNVISDFTTAGDLNRFHPQDLGDISYCDLFSLRITSDEDVTKYITVKDGILVPFYSSCDVTTLTDRTEFNVMRFSQLKLNGNVVDWDNPNEADDSIDIVTNVEPTEKHYITANCFVSLDPDWLGMEYYVPDNGDVISSIPFDFKMNQFSVNLNGELASYIEYLSTPEWLKTYEIGRIKGNTIIVDEIEAITGNEVLFKIDPDIIIDDSDNFFGPGNNGRNCIQQSDQYEYDIFGCFFENDKVGYSNNAYLNGDITTTGIARLANKFDLLFYTAGEAVQSKIVNSEQVVGKDYVIQATPKQYTDFNFYIEYGGDDICPYIYDKSYDSNGCSYSLLFFGEKNVILNGEIITLTNGIGLVGPVEYGSVQTIYVDETECLIVRCQQTSFSSSIIVEIPWIEIISEDELNSQAALRLSENLENNLEVLSNLQGELDVLKNNITSIMQALSEIDFNITAKNPFEDFSSLRDNVAYLYSVLQNETDYEPPEIEDECTSGPFASVQCFLNDFLGTLITVVFVAIIAGIVFLIVRKVISKRNESV
eukprot:TRINITY_DN9717_c0_g1_i1.p1 TRINITY_DN9717_c0_g1~~TRINITY_DN9717_c0_g1_i1.p1  ORF type:complete len:946 (-),score=206.97 TRINITY_DN9717_c0_g1_i1:43-2880(-)